MNTIRIGVTTSLNGEETIWKQESPEQIGSIMVDMIDARESDAFVAIATQGNGMYSTNFDPSLSINESPNNQLVELRNYPNPFKNQTTIEYVLSQRGYVNLSLMDVNGRLVKHLFAVIKKKMTYCWCLL